MVEDEVLLQQLADKRAWAIQQQQTHDDEVDKEPLVADHTGVSANELALLDALTSERRLIREAARSDATSTADEEDEEEAMMIVEEDNGSHLEEYENMDDPSAVSLGSTDETDPDLSGDERRAAEEEERADDAARKQWKRRHAHSIQEGIRREKTTNKLSSLLNTKRYSKTLRGNRRKYASSIISGIIHGVAEEADGLRVEVNSSRDTHFWNKHIESIRIDFSRLGFKPLRLGGLYDAISNVEESLPSDDVDELSENLELSAVSTADEGFERIDVDKSGALDQDEIAEALTIASASDNDRVALQSLAEQLVKLYDTNGDGVVDREEYQLMVEDMAKLRRIQLERRQSVMKKEGELAAAETSSTTNEGRGWKNVFKDGIRNVLKRQSVDDRIEHDIADAIQQETGMTTDDDTEPGTLSHDTSTPGFLESMPRGSGTIVLEDLRLDLRRLIFGAIPLVKKLTPGGPLVLEPFKATVVGSFTAEDVKQSFLVDMGLRRLAARALRRRVGSLRDFVDGAVFYGRTWNRASEYAPVVDIPCLTSVEFDEQNRMIVTGVAKIRTQPNAPVVENAFKLRTKLGTRKNGQVIRLVEPELALVLECPKAWERNIVSVCNKLDIPVPEKPEPIYGFFPIYSPFKLEDNDGYDMGPDNCLKRIFIQDGALRFQMSAVMRPGRFLGSHYLAFSFPTRNVILTLDRVKAGIRAARRNKREARRKARLLKKQRREQGLLDDPVVKRDELKFVEPGELGSEGPEEKPIAEKKPVRNKRSFLSRFMEGYAGVGKIDRARNERLTRSISDWFGRQVGSSGGVVDEGAKK